MTGFNLTGQDQTILFDPHISLSN